MITLNRFIIERLKLTKDSKLHIYNYHPKDFDELRSLLKQLLEERGPDANLNDIDISKINSFYDEEKKLGLFEKLNPRNIKIDKWDVSNVKDMSYMFYDCTNFNCNLSKLDVRNVEDMDGIFYGCESFTGQGLENWKPIKCKDMRYMFDNCTSLKNKPNWYKE